MTKRIIPREPGTVFHVPYEECDEWLIVNDELTVTLTPGINLQEDGALTRTIEEHDGTWSWVHLAKDCRGTDVEYGEWEFA